jgi:hypothetical protein
VNRRMSTARHHHSKRVRQTAAVRRLVDITLIVGSVGVGLIAWWLVTPLLSLLGHFSTPTSPLRWLQPVAVNTLSIVCLSSWLVAAAGLLLRRLRETELSVASLISLLVPVVNLVTLARLVVVSRDVVDIHR